MSWSMVLAAISLGVAMFALGVSLLPRRSDAEAKLRRMQVELVELADLVDYQSTSIKKLHARAATRAARDPNPNGDPMARLPGESDSEWKNRMGTSLIPNMRRN